MGSNPQKPIQLSRNASFTTQGFKQLQQDMFNLVQYMANFQYVVNKSDKLEDIIPTGAQNGYTYLSDGQGNITTADPGDVIERIVTHEVDLQAVIDSADGTVVHL